MFTVSSVTSIILIYLQLCGGVFGQLANFGKCRTDFPVVTDFQLDKYLGTWYEQCRYFALIEVGATCVYAVYEQNKDDANKIDVVNSGYNKWTKLWTSIRGNATLDENRSNNEAKLTVNFPTFVGKSTGIYWVLGTDYEKYSIVWSCKQYVFFHRNYLWIITRDQFPDESIVENAKEIIRNMGLSVTPLQKTDQTECASEDENTANPPS